MRKDSHSIIFYFFWRQRKKIKICKINYKLHVHLLNTNFNFYYISNLFHINPIYEKYLKKNII